MISRPGMRVALAATARQAAGRASGSAMARTRPRVLPLGRRFNSTKSSSSSGSGNGTVIAACGALVMAAAGYWALRKSDSKPASAIASALPTSFSPSRKDYDAVYKAIKDLLEGDESSEYEDGSYGPVILRLGWHASGTYDKDTNTGGSNGATMRFAPERDHGANAGLTVAQAVLEPLKQQFPWISYSDLWTLAAVCAIQQMSLGNVTVPWRPGRQDKDASFTSPDGRLPDGSKKEDHLRAIFYRMGFNDQEIVALSGAHALGRCHTTRSGFDGPWTFSPTVLTNDYYRLLCDEKWTPREWNGPFQYIDNGSHSLMMLPTDMALVQDKKFKEWVETYAKDENKFYSDFSKVLARLFELGVPFPDDSTPWEFDYLE